MQTTQKSNRRVTIAVIIVIIAVAALAGGYYFLQPKPAPQLTKFSSGDSFATSEQFYLVETVGTQQGFWKQNGLDPQFVSFAGSAKLSQAIAANSVDIGLGIVGDLVSAKANGVPLKLLSVYITNSSWSVYVKGNGSIQSPKDLDGKKIGVTGVTGIAHIMGVTFAKYYGIKVQLVPLGGAPQNLAALESGQIDAFLQAASFPAPMVQTGELRVIAQMKNVLPSPWAEYGVFASDRLLQNNSDLARRYVKAVLQTVQYLDNNPNVAAGVYANATKASPDIAKQVVAKIDWWPAGNLDPNAFNNIVTLYKAGGDISANSTITMQDAYNGSFLPASSGAAAQVVLQVAAVYSWRSEGSNRVACAEAA